MGAPKSRVAEVRIRGPMAPYVENLRAELLAAGYTPLTIVNKLRSIGYVSRWLQANGLGIEDLTEARLDEYLGERRERGGRWEISRPALAPLLEFLRSRSLLRPSPAEYLGERRERGGRWEISRPALAPLLEFLRSRSLLRPSPAEPVPVTGTDVLLAAFKRYLLEERGHLGLIHEIGPS